MEAVVKELTALDQKAKMIVAAAENELANLDNIIQAKGAELVCEIEAALNTKIHHLRIDSAEYLSLKKAEIDERTRSELARMEAEWEVSSAKWQNEIYNFCIGE